MERILSIRLLMAIVIMALSPPTWAQWDSPPLAKCIDQSRGQSFIILQSLYAYQEGYPTNNGMASRDPSGRTFLRIPAAQPTQQAFFMTWQWQLIELNTWTTGPIVVGHCQTFGALPAPPKPAHSNFSYTGGNQGVILPDGGNSSLPQQIYGHSIGISPPFNATPEQASACKEESGGDRDEFLDCLLPQVITPTQNAAYACMRQQGIDEVELAACLAKLSMGSREARAVDQSMECYRQYGPDYEKYPLCMAEQNFDPEIADAVACFQKQAQQGSTSSWGVAMCLAGNALDLNAELTVAVECAATSGGEPLVFAGCTGGRLTAMELQKCFTVGIGGNGCFGENNEIVKGLQALGMDMQQVMGPNGFVVQSWNTAVNDFQHGPGPNNDMVRAIDTVNRDLNNGLGKNNDVRRVLTDIGLGGIF